MALPRIMYYVNQFFGGMGGEDKADVPATFREEAVGPARRFQELCQGSLEVAVTAYCGDNYFAEHESDVLASILEVARKYHVGMLVAGPAFGAGRYGFACVEICHFLNVSLNIPCISGMSVESPGVELYKQYKDKGVFLIPTSEAVSGMGEALSKMARLASRVIKGEAIGPAPDEGYIPRGFRLDAVVDKTGAERAVDILLDKLAGRTFATEIPIETIEGIPVAPPIANLKDARLALVSTAGVVACGNPDGFKTYGNTQWRKYSFDKMNSMKDARWDVYHGGYNTVFMHENPNYGVPLDVCREIEKEKAFGKLYPFFYSTPGNMALISAMQAISREILRDMKAEGIDGVLLVSTWGTCTRSGAAIAREIERGGVPVAHITSMATLAKQMKSNRIVVGTKIPHPCGDPNLSIEADNTLRREIVKTALKALQAGVSGPTIFVPDISYTSG